MTLVCGFKGVREAPILIGDLLISDFTNGDAQRVALPTIGKIADVAPEWGSHPISGMRQKLTIISPYLAIGWSGSLIHARLLISDLIQETKTRSFTHRTLGEYFQSYKHADLSEIQLTGFIIENGEVGYIGWNCHQLRDVLEEPVLICGSATHDKEVEGIISRIKSSFPTSHQLNAGISDSALGICVAGQFMMNDMLGGKSLSTFFYGGGYEIITVSQNGFYKLDKIGYMYWDCLIEGEAEFKIWPIKLLSLSYRDMNLLYRTLTFEWQNGKNAPSIKNHELFIVSSITEKDTDSTPFDKPPLDFVAIANFIRISNPSNQHEADGLHVGFVLSAGSKDGQKHIDFFDTENGIGMTISQEFLNSIGQAILSGNSSIKLAP